MIFRESLEYINHNVGFDFRYETTLPHLDSESTNGYFFKTLNQDGYNVVKGERWGSFPTDFDFSENKVTLNSPNLKKYKSVIHEIGMMACDPMDLEKELKEYLLQENYINELINENLYFVVWYGWEGDSFTSKRHVSKLSFADVLNNIFEEFKIPRHKIIFLVSNLIGEKLLKNRLTLF